MDWIDTLMTAWRQWRTRRHALRLRARADAYASSQPSLAEDLRAAAEAVLIENEGGLAVQSPHRADASACRRGAVPGNASRRQGHESRFPERGAPACR